jgi:hypothetical protein
MAWFNGMTERQRFEALRAANTDCPADAWAHRKRVTAQELVTALRDALEACDFVKQRSHPAMGEALDTLTEEARATFARCRS